MLITSLDNQRVKQIRKLKSRKWRERLGSYFIEGLHLVFEALDVGLELEQIIICPELAGQSTVKRIAGYKRGVNCAGSPPASYSVRATWAQ